MSTVRAPDQLVGRKVGEFILRERIGEGGFGAVYRATQPALDREAVVKLLHPRLHAAKAATDRFLREAKLASKLDHPYAAHVYAFGVDPESGELWIAMELVRGTPLDQILKIQGPVPLERFVPLLDRICEVVHTAHEQGIVHRDLKPANVMVLARAGRLLPKLLDFGIAKGLSPRDIGTAQTQLGTGRPRSDSGPLELGHTLETGTSNEPADLDLTQRGAVMGSPPYMAPEQWLDAGEVDARTDLYALGVLAYETLTGKPPFTGTTITAIATAHAIQPPPPLDPRFPPALDKVFAKVLAKESGERYPDALAFASAFRQAAGLGGEPIALPTIEPARRAAALEAAPQPIAEAVAALEAARNAHQARDHLVQLARTITRYVGLLALACRSRISGGTDPPGVGDAIRALHRRQLSDAEWLELARQLTRAWIDRRDAYPIPELVDALEDDRLVGPLAALAALRDGEAPTEDALLGMLEVGTVHAGQLLEALAFASDYQLVVTGAGGVAERWMGVRRTQRTTMVVRGKGVPAGVPVVLDRDGVPVLSLAPLMQIAAPTPGAPVDLFLFDGRDRRGAKLVALPSGFEHHDDSLWDWFRAQLSGSFDEAEAAASEGKPPYRGLLAFTAEDGAMFFGREKLVDAFVNRLQVQPLLAVVGRSGAGKSSFVQAGVIPALPPSYRALVMRPGASPLGALSARLQQAGVATDADLRAALERDRNALGAVLRADAAERGPIVLVVDQLEELFTLCHDADERRLFAEALASAARVAEDPVRVVFTLRDDFLLRTEQIAALRNRIGHGLQLLTVPAADDLLRILVEPAKRAGYEFEDPELPAEMVKDVADQPGALALISFTAAKLWELRDRHFKQLTRAAYRSLGGVGGALARHAELTLDAMLPEERKLTREAFRHLVTSQNTRAVLQRSELRQLLGDSEHADAVMEKLVAARLLVAAEDESGGETIEIVHEALLGAWPRLVEWRREDLEGARFHEQLRSAAKQWEERGQPKGLLWRGDALAELARWRGRHPIPLMDVELAFANASTRDAARGRRLRRSLIAIAFGVLATGTVVLLSLNQTKEAERRRAELNEHTAHQQVAELYEEQGRQLFVAGDPLRAAVYIDAARKRGATGAALDYLAHRIQAILAHKIVAIDRPGTMFAGAFSGDGRHVYTAGIDGARIWDAESGRLTSTLPGATSRVFALQPSPDGTRIAAGGVDRVVRIWNAATGKLEHALTGHEGLVVGLAWDRDGHRLASSSVDGSARIWSVDDGRLVATIPAAPGSTALFGADGTVFAAASDGTLARHDAATGTVVEVVERRAPPIAAMWQSDDRTRTLVSRGDETLALWVAGARAWSIQLATAASAGAFSPDARRVAIAVGADIHILDSATGARTAVLRGHRGQVTALAFRSDGAMLASTSVDGTIRLWDGASGNQIMLAPSVDVLGWVAFSPDGGRLFSGGGAGPATIWAARADVRRRTRDGLGHPLESVDVARDGALVVGCAGDGSVRAWGPTGDVIASLQLPPAKEPSCRVAVARDGSFAVAATDAAVVWDIASGKAVRTLGASGVNAVRVSRDGTRILTAHLDGTVRVWSARSGTLERAIATHQATAAWSPDGRILTCGKSPGLHVWRPTGQLEIELPLDERCMTAAFSSDTRFVLAHSGTTARVWSTDDWQLQLVLEGHQDAIFDATFEGGLIVTTSADHTARVWDARSGKALESLSHPSDVIGGFRTAAGLITASGEYVYEWDLGGQTPVPADAFAGLPFVLRDGLLVPRDLR